MEVKNETLELGCSLKILCMECSLVTLEHINHFRELFSQITYYSQRLSYATVQERACFPLKLTFVFQ